MTLKYGLNFTIRYATSHIVKPVEFTITGNQFGIVAALWWRSDVAKPGSRQTQNVDDDIDEFAPLEAFIVPHLREHFYVKFDVTTQCPL